MTVRTSKLALTLALSCTALGAVAAEIPTNAALMQAMDKVTGRVHKITVPVSSKVSFGDFSLVLRSCKKRPAEETPENFAFVDVADKSFGSDEYNIFRGWLLSSTPGINAIEHPIYDVWLLECIDVANVDSSVLLSKEELDKRDNLPSKDVLLGKEKPEVQEAKPDETVSEPEPQKPIRIKEFMQEDRDIEKDIKPAPAYISESSAAYVSDIEEGAEPENLLQFTKMQEVKPEEAESAAAMPETVKAPAADDDLSAAIDAEINGLNGNAKRP